MQYERVNPDEAKEEIQDKGYKKIKKYKSSKFYIPTPGKNTKKAVKKIVVKDQS